MPDTELLLKKLLIPGEIQYQVICNADGKRWFVPLCSIRRGLALYQPSAFYGRMLKLFLPYLGRTVNIFSGTHFSLRRICLNDHIKRIISRVFGINDFLFSVYGGTPGPHMKIIMQVYTRGGIAGYCKFTDNPVIAERFEQEHKLLSYLHQCGVTNVPQSLFCGKVGDVFVFIQSSVRTFRSKPCFCWSEKHTDFLKKIYENTTVRERFEKTQFCRMLDDFQRSGKIFFDEIEWETIQEAIKKVRCHFLNQDVDFCMVHGDFVPWNMLIENGDIHIFDWEFATWSFPPFLDYFHFYTQTAMLQNRWKRFKILSGYNEMRDALSKRMSDPDIYYLAYLLYMMYHYSVVCRGDFPKDERCRSLWQFLIGSLTVKNCA